jgi:hypothetical protein
MKILAAFALVMVLGDVAAQINADLVKNARSPILQRQEPLASKSWIRSTPVFALPSTDYANATAPYWQGVTYTRYSEDGRFKSTYLFDVQGTLRESRASYSLKKSGILSYWRVQISPQRSRPQFIYTIH